MMLDFVDCEPTLTTSFRSSSINVNSQQAMYQALVDFVQAEWVDGPCEGGQICESSQASQYV